jgi:hypothetical protein
MKFPALKEDKADGAGGCPNNIAFLKKEKGKGLP